MGDRVREKEKLFFFFFKESIYCFYLICFSLINFCIVGQAFQSEVQLIYNIVLISAVWQSDQLYTHTHTNTYKHILFLDSLP